MISEKKPKIRILEHCFSRVSLVVYFAVRLCDFVINRRIFSSLYDELNNAAAIDVVLLINLVFVIISSHYFTVTTSHGAVWKTQRSLSLECLYNNAHSTAAVKISFY